MMVTLIIIASLLAGGAVVVAMQLGSNRGTDLTRSGMTATYCAETGLERAGPQVTAAYLTWNTPPNLCANAVESTCVPANPGAEAPIFAGINHDIDGDGIPDFVLYLRDDDDDAGSATNQVRTTDSNSKIFIVSTCIKFPDTPKQVKELVSYGGGGNCYPGQLGGCNSNGNDN
jgi:hypothetical protein